MLQQQCKVQSTQSHDVANNQQRARHMDSFADETAAIRAQVGK